MYRPQSFHKGFPVLQGCGRDVIAHCPVVCHFYKKMLYVHIAVNQMQIVPLQQFLVQWQTGEVVVTVYVEMLASDAVAKLQHNAFTEANFHPIAILSCVPAEFTHSHCVNQRAPTH